MVLKTTVWDVQDHIKTSARQIGYLKAALEDGDPKVVAAALGDIAKARGMAKIADETGLTREGLYKALSPNGDPRLSMFLGVAKALGLRVRITNAKPQANRDSSIPRAANSAA